MEALRLSLPSINNYENPQFLYCRNTDHQTVSDGSIEIGDFHIHAGRIPERRRWLHTGRKDLEELHRYFVWQTHNWLKGGVQSGHLACAKKPPTFRTSQSTWPVRLQYHYPKASRGRNMEIAKTKLVQAILNTSNDNNTKTLDNVYGGRS